MCHQTRLMTIKFLHQAVSLCPIARMQVSLVQNTGPEGAEAADLQAGTQCI